MDYSTWKYLVDNGYSPVEYIKNISTKGGLDTGMNMSITDYSVEVKFKQDEISNGIVLGTNNINAGTLWFYNYHNSGHFGIYANNTAGWAIPKRLWEPCDANIHTVRFEGHPTGCDISWNNGNTYFGTYTTPQQYSTDNLFVFGRNVGANAYLGRIYYVKLWNTDTGAMLINYIPCVRKSDNTPGFYNLVNDEFKTITNATSKWEAGPDIIIKLNIEFPIYNSDGSSFYGLVLRKSVVDSVVMSLGDKITGDVLYKDNTLAVTMREYVEYRQNPYDENEEPIRYSLVNPPTIVREGMVADNGELKGMTKYSFEFYHPMYQLSNFPFTDVATKTGEEKYLSQNKIFSWIGKPQDYIDKLNKNLQGTVWYVRKSDRFPVEKDDELSEVQQFDNVSVAEAIKRGYEIWGIPYIVSQLPSTDQLYAQGKRFVVEYGLPSNEIYENESARQLDTPYVFQMGQGVGLKNNSRTPRNNKIVTRIAGYGSEDNVPYGYPQIVWTGNQDWDYTINNDPNNPLSYPIYKGIVGGQYVKLIKHPFTRTHLMPSIFTETVNKKVNPNAVGYDPTIEIKDYYDAVATQEYPYVNEINLQAPSYESHEFADIKPELDADRDIGIVSAVPLNADLTPADHWDDSMDDDGNYLQSYFQITLPQLSFDLYACAAITQEMQINMRSGACIGCTFPIQVDWDDYKRNFYDEDGNFVPDGEQRDLTKYPKSNLGQISVVVQKDNSTFGTLMPNIYQQPKADDLFVFIGISLPTSYITNAEVRLDAAMKSYMLENNVYYFDYPLKFDEHFLATHTYILEQIRPNSIIHFDYGGVEQQLFVKQLTVKYGNAPLPQYDITLTDNIEVVLNQIGQVADDVEKLSSLITILRQSYNRNVWNELAKKLSKTQDDTAQGFIRFMQGLQVGNQFVSGILGEGGVFRKDADGKTYIEADKMYVRMKAYFDSVEIREYQHTSGNRIASQAKGFTASRVEWLDASGNVTDNINNVVKFRCYWRAKDDEHETQNQFVVGDQAFMEYSDVVDGNLIQKRFWRVVVGRNVSLTEDGEAWIDLSNKANDTITYIDHQGVSRTKSVTGFEPNSSIPQPEDEICQLGNVWDTERQGAIIEYVSGGDAPSYQIFQGIDSFSLNGKNMVGLGYSSLTGKAYMNVYGDAYIGDPQGSTYVKYEQRNSATHAPKLTIKADVDIQSTFGGQTLEERVVEYAPPFDDTEIWAEMANLQDQIDGAIETYYMTGEPSLSLPPVISTQAHPYDNPWLDGTETPAERTKILNNHVGDLYYDKATGRGYRFMYDDENQVFLWTELTDADVAEALRVANDAKDTADGKRTVYSTWGAWIKSGVNTLEVGDLFIPTSDTTQGGVTYKAKKVYKCTTEGTNAFEEINYTDDSALNTFKLNQYVQQLINGTISSDITTAQNTASGAATAAAAAQGTADSAAAAAAALGYLSQALGQDTAISGGLVLSTLIGLRDGNGQLWSGINGAYQTAETGTGYKGHGIAAWYGGAMVDKEVATTATDFAKSLFRFDGSGYLASGNITWDKNGIVTIANVYSDVNGQPVPWSGATLQYITNLSTLLPITIQSGTTYLDPQVGFKQLSVLGKTVATQEWVNQNFITTSFFDELFQLYNNTTKISPNGTIPTDKTNLNIKAMFGFWTEKYISALGKNTSGGGGSGGDIDMTTVWSALANNTNEQINLSHLTTALSGYATQSWVYQQLTGGTVTAVKVGNTSYSPTDGVVSLPAYPTVPTNVSAFTNDAGYTTNIGTVTQVKVGTTAYNPSSGVVSLPAYPTTLPASDVSAWAKASTKPSYTLDEVSDGTTRKLVTYTFETGDSNGTFKVTPSTGITQNVRIAGLGARAFDSTNYVVRNDRDRNVVKSIYSISCCSIFTGNKYTDAPTSGWVSGLALGSNWDNNHYQHYLVEVGDRWYTTRSYSDDSMTNWNTFAYLTDNVASATKLQTARTIWGQNFDGTGNISGSLSGVSEIDFSNANGSTMDKYGNIKLKAASTSTSYWIVRNVDDVIGIVMTAAGNVGIGTTSPSYKLHVNGTFHASGNSTIGGSFGVSGATTLTGNVTFGGNLYLDNSKYIYIKDTDGTDRSVMDISASNNLIIGGGSRAVGTTYIYGTNIRFRYGASGTNEGMILDSGGNVGIGTDSPAYKLDVQGTLGVNDIVTVKSYIYVDRVPYGALPVGTQLTILSARSKNAGTGNYAYNTVIATFGSGETGTTVNNFPVRIGSASGATVISAGESAKTFPSQNTGICNTENLYLEADGSIAMYAGVNNDSTNYSSKLAMFINTSCNVGIGTSSPSYKLHVVGTILGTVGVFSNGYVSALGQNTSSDIRKKDIKENFALSVEDIASAPSVKYLWKDDKDKGLQVGSIAQYWQNVLPEAVHEDNDGYLTMQYGVIALLSSINVARKVQDHERRIKELEKECERLRTEVEQLRMN